MAGLRIKDLDTTATLPTEAVLPIDAKGLTAALAITPKDSVDASVSDKLESFA